MALRPPEPLHLLSICTGGGGLDLGVELAIPGARSVCMVEREAFGVATLVEAMEAGLLAPAPVWSDARTFRGRPWRGLVDGLVGGIPCQPHSMAGKRLAHLDERDLWSATRRLIVQTRPWFVLIENVAGMLSSGGAERVWRDLRRLGFQVEGGLFTAEEVGAPHIRERLFILALADAYGARGRPGFRQARPLDNRHELTGQGADLADAECNRWGEGSGALQSWTGQSEPSIARKDVGHAEGGPRGLHAGQRIGGSRAPDARGPGDAVASLFPPGPDDIPGWASYLKQRPGLEPAVRRGADGLAFRVDSLRVLGNGVVPLEAAHALRTLAVRASARSAAAAELVRMMRAA